MTPITEEQIEAEKSAAGGWKRATLAGWGVPWPAPKGWKKTILAHGIPYNHDLNDHVELSPEQELGVTQEGLQRMMDASGSEMIDGAPFECTGQLDIDPAKLLRKVVSAVISHGQGHILYEFPEVMAFFGSRIPQREEVAHLHRVDDRMFEAADKWPNRIKSEGSA